MIKKTILTGLFIALLALKPGWSTGIDVIVMVDTSESMFPFFDDLINYLIKDILEKRLNQGDTFYLLSFADEPEYELSAAITDATDLEKVIGRILLLNALGRYTDLITAINYLYAFTKSLQEQSEKLVLLLTDGIHDPPPGSPTDMDPDRVRETLLQSAQRIKREGWSVHILQMPLTDSQEDRPTKTSFLGDMAEVLETDIVPYSEEDKEVLDKVIGFPVLEFPGYVGEVSRRFKARFQVNNPAKAPVLLVLSEIRTDGYNILGKRITVRIKPEQKKRLSLPIKLPDSLPEGEHQLPIKLIFRDDSHIAPTQGILQFTYVPGRSILPYFLYLLILVVLLLLLYILIRLFIVLKNRIQELSFPQFYRTAAVGQKEKTFKRPLVMHVILQNSRIGFRNIHTVPSGRSCSVGGDGSTFLIYYVPMPRRIGVIVNDGKKYNFIPKRKEFFPNLTDPLYDCLDKDIQAVSSRGHEVTFTFKEYISPLEEINNLMHSIRYAEPEGLLALKKKEEEKKTAERAAQG